jgi:hypothetical protein
MKAPDHHIDFDYVHMIGDKPVITFECHVCHQVMCELYLSDKAEVDITVTCKKCGGTFTGKNLWAEPA